MLIAFGFTYPIVFLDWMLLKRVWLSFCLVESTLLNSFGFLTVHHARSDRPIPNVFTYVGCKERALSIYSLEYVEHSVMGCVVTLTSFSEDVLINHLAEQTCARQGWNSGAKEVCLEHKCLFMTIGKSKFGNWNQRSWWRWFMLPFDAKS